VDRTNARIMYIEGISSPEEQKAFDALVTEVSKADTGTACSISSC